MCYIQLSFYKNRVVDVMMWKNMVEPDRIQKTI